MYVTLLTNPRISPWIHQDVVYSSASNTILCDYFDSIDRRSQYHLIANFQAVCTYSSRTMYTNTYLLYSSHTMNYIIGYRRVYSIMYIESVVCVHITCYYYFANSVHNIHSAVWCVCICILYSPATRFHSPYMLTSLTSRNIYA